MDALIAHAGLFAVAFLAATLLPAQSEAVLLGLLMTELDKTSVAYAIVAAKEPRVRVIAGPGTGKSYAMKRRVARLLETDVKSPGLSQEC